MLAFQKEEVKLLKFKIKQKRKYIEHLNFSLKVSELELKKLENKLAHYKQAGY